MFQTLLFLQETATDVEATAEQQSIVQMLLEGSMFGLFIIILLIIMSFVALYIFIERYLTIKRASQIDDSFMNNIRMNVQNGNLNAARSLCQNTDSPISRMVEKGLMRIGKPVDDIEHAIENVGRLEIYKMEKNVNILSIIAGVSPMFGFLGTIAGMIQTFAALSTANNLSISVIAGGIYVKMFTSGIGLIVGIIAFIFFNYLNTMIDRVINQMENSTFSFLDLLQEPAN
ncbi:MAG: MotA/TolQ/ExbB proton channel family protein [Saprospiraceae bacterium]|nr:MotA/TolQ/ExbB proton channel family protein [Saprospiraceae bacterium]